MVPSSTELPRARFRQSIAFRKDGSFHIGRLHPADAHYSCSGWFTASTNSELKAGCFDKLKQGEVRFVIHLVSVETSRVVLRVEEVAP